MWIQEICMWLWESKSEKEGKGTKGQLGESFLYKHTGLDNLPENSPIKFTWTAVFCNAWSQTQECKFSSQGTHLLQKLSVSSLWFLGSHKRHRLVCIQPKALRSGWRQWDSQGECPLGQAYPIISGQQWCHLERSSHFLNCKQQAQSVITGLKMCSGVQKGDLEANVTLSVCFLRRTSSELTLQVPLKDRWMVVGFFFLVGMEMDNIHYRYSELWSLRQGLVNFMPSDVIEFSTHLFSPALLVPRNCEVTVSRYLQKTKVFTFDMQHTDTKMPRAGCRGGEGRQRLHLSLQVVFKIMKCSKAQ